MNYRKTLLNPPPPGRRREIFLRGGGLTRFFENLKKIKIGKPKV
jgi:hypothetical protein